MTRLEILEMLNIILHAEYPITIINIMIKEEQQKEEFLASEIDKL